MTCPSLAEFCFDFLALFWQQNALMFSDMLVIFA